eukprot:TRINITY_DN719_c0_g11_i1.p1 TRINITY_DN719_c0_g11~~TRINITY_DN719_c0_g11_i1.p1  ORF type:complete len:611 (-),score=198.59 TRINITY_DN719_c0_g11_i1:22-1854(-)
MSDEEAPLDFATSHKEKLERMRQMAELEAKAALEAAQDQAHQESTSPSNEPTLAEATTSGAGETHFETPSASENTPAETPTPNKLSGPVDTPTSHHESSETHETSVPSFETPGSASSVSTEQNNKSDSGTETSRPQTNKPANAEIVEENLSVSKNKSAFLREDQKKLEQLKKMAELEAKLKANPPSSTPATLALPKPNPAKPRSPKLSDENLKIKSVSSPESTSPRSASDSGTETSQPQTNKPVNAEIVEENLSVSKNKSAFLKDQEKRLEQQRKMAELAARLKTNPNPSPTKPLEEKKPKVSEPPKIVVPPASSTPTEKSGDVGLEQKEKKNVPEVVRADEPVKEDPVDLAENTKRKLSMFDVAKLEKQRKLAELQARLKASPTITKSPEESPKPASTTAKSTQEKPEVPKQNSETKPEEENKSEEKSDDATTQPVKDANVDQPKLEEKKPIEPKPEEKSEIPKPEIVRADEPTKEEPVNLAENTKRKLSMFDVAKLEKQRKIAEIQARLKANPGLAKPPEESAKSASKSPKPPKVEQKQAEVANKQPEVVNKQTEYPKAESVPEVVNRQNNDSSPKTEIVEQSIQDVVKVNLWKQREIMRKQTLSGKK